MKNMETFWQTIAAGAGLPEEPGPGQSVVELLGDSRLLVEHHRGILAYSREQILIGVPFGALRVCGADLELMQMSSRQLIVTGRIDSIVISREEAP